MKRVAYAAVTIAIMLVISRFLVRIVDATVQIDNNIGMLFLMTGIALSEILNQ